MDLLSSIRKSGSRGGVNFSWDEVSTSQHRENYLGHSLMAPVGRWQKGKDLNWYAKADDKNSTNETAEEKRVRERKEEIRRIKEAEEDALARALGLPVTVRNGEGTGANNIDVGEMRKVIKDTEVGDDEIDQVGKAKGFGDFVGRVKDEDELETSIEQPQQGGLMRKGGERDRPRRERGKDDRSRSRSRERRHRRQRHRSRSGERHRHRRRETDRPERRERSRSDERRDRRHRSRSADRYRPRRDDREPRRDSDRRLRRSRSPDRRDRRSRRERD